MPLYYFRPLDLHADKHDKTPLIETDFDLGKTMVYIAIGIVIFMLFVVFLVIPMLEVLGQ